MSAFVSFPSIFVGSILSLVSVSEPVTFARNILFARGLKGYFHYQVANTQVTSRPSSYLTRKLSDGPTPRLTSLLVNF